MRLSFRLRIVLTLAPLLVLLGLLGGVGAALLYRLGGRIDLILRENYNSVVYMQELREATERIDSSFQFALAGEEKKSRQDYQSNWRLFRARLEDEQHNITLPGEEEAVERLTELADRYRKQGDHFFSRPPGSRERSADYFGRGGLYATFKEIKGVSGAILTMNQQNMEYAEADARRTAHTSLIGFSAGLALAVVLAGWLAWHMARSTLRPVQAVTRSALAIGRGELDQLVPVLSHDELGQLADAFNTMARQLRELRQSNSARLLRTQQTTRATIESFPDPVLVIDNAGAVEMANPSARRLLGAAEAPERDGAGGGLAVAWVPPAELAGPLQEAVRDQRPYLPEDFDKAVRLLVDGRERFFLPRVLPIAGPAAGPLRQLGALPQERVVLGAAVLLQDVTRFRLLDQVKSDLVATVSHELKTPLTSIRLVLHLLLEESVGPLTSKQAELLLDARDNGERLLAVVNNLLDLARLETGRSPLELRPERPADLVQAAVEPFLPRAADRGVEVEVRVAEGLPEVAADAQRLRHALGNLLDNALAYTDRGGRIAVSADSADGGVAFAVVDTGVGIPPEHLPRVFDRFFRIPGQSRGGGSGLGLAIVREIAAAHGGTAHCDSRPGEGTTFRLILPGVSRKSQIPNPKSQ